MSLQLVNVIGRATKDAEKKVSKDGVSYITFRLAVNRADGSPTFYNIVLFGRYGEVLQEHITKGREVFISGRLEVSEKGYISVIADHVELLRFPRAKKAAQEKVEETKIEENRTK